MDAPLTASGSKLSRFVRKYYAPVLLQPVVKGAVLLIFGGLFVVSTIYIQSIELGLGEPASDAQQASEPLIRRAFGAASRLIPHCILQ